MGNTESYACADDGDGNTQCNNYGKNPREIFLNRDTVFGVRVDEKQLPSDFSYTEWDIAITDFSYYHKVGAGADENDIDTDGTALNGAARVQVIDLSVFEDATQYVLEYCHTNVVCRVLYRANAADDAWSSDPWPQKVHDAAFFIHGRPFEDPQHCKQHFCAVRVTFQITNKTAGGYETPKSGRRLRISSKVKPATQEGVEISQTFTGVAYTPATNAPTASPTESPTAHGDNDSDAHGGAPAAMQWIGEISGIVALVVIVAYVVQRNMKKSEAEGVSSKFSQVRVAGSVAGTSRKIKFRKLHEAA